MYAYGHAYAYAYVTSRARVTQLQCTCYSMFPPAFFCAWLYFVFLYTLFDVPLVFINFCLSFFFFCYVILLGISFRVFRYSSLVRFARLVHLFNSLVRSAHSFRSYVSLFIVFYFFRYFCLAKYRVHFACIFFFFYLNLFFFRASAIFCLHVCMCACVYQVRHHKNYTNVPPKGLQTPLRSFASSFVFLKIEKCETLNHALWRGGTGQARTLCVYIHAKAVHRYVCYSCHACGAYCAYVRKNTTRKQAILHVC